MTLLQWFIFFLAVQVIHYLGTWKLYQKAGRKSWEAAVPVYNAVVLMGIIRKPKWWTVLLFIPIVNLIMFPVVWVQTLRNFDKTSAVDYILGIVTLGLYIYYINYFEDVTYVNQAKYDQEKTADGTLGSLLFAVVVATIVHTYIMQPFTIPTSSLEKTLLVGDFLFVSKFHYGARTPMTPIAAPMVHDSIPLAKVKSFTSFPQLPSFRFPGFEKVEKNDIVVFNWPADTVKYFGDTKTTGLRKPIDKKSNYVKRCVGTPGDIFSVKNGFVFINDKQLVLSDRAKPQYNHTIYSKGGIQANTLKQYGSTEFTRSFIVRLNNENQALATQPYWTAYPVKNEDGSVTIYTSQNGIPPQIIKDFQLDIQEVLETSMVANLTLDGAEELRKTTGIDSVIRYIASKPEAVFPNTHKKTYPIASTWNQDNIGPIYIPEEGKSVNLTVENLPLYKKIIEEYEHNTLKVENGSIIINGQPATSYTFKQNYYWMMGDNRHRSEDSRYWGFVPEDHIVGKPVFVWMSIDQNESWKNIGQKIRWDRLFTTVGGSGKPVSYFKYFVIALVGWFIFDYFRKKKKAKA